MGENQVCTGQEEEEIQKWVMRSWNKENKKEKGRIHDTKITSI